MEKRLMWTMRVWQLGRSWVRLLTFLLLQLSHS
jgi:hypothetical protein